MAQRSAGKMRHFDDICRLLLTSLVIKIEMRYMFYLADGQTVIPNSLQSIYDEGSKNHTECSFIYR